MLLYPYSFFDFDGGVKMEDKTIVKWLNEILERLKESDKERDVEIISCGNTCVVGMKFNDEYKFIVAENYKETTLAENEINEYVFS